MTASAKLRLLADAVLAEAEHLQTTDRRLFASPMTAAHAAVPLLADAAAAMARQVAAPGR